MLVFFTIFVCLAYILGYAFLMRICYTFYRPWCRKLNARISTVVVKHLGYLFEKYIDFRFITDSSMLDELPEQYLVISNHQSLLDIILYMYYLEGDRLRFVAKKELGFGIPLISLMLRTGEHCLVQRKGNPSQAMQAMDVFAAKSIANNWIPIIFPEGTRSRNGSLGTFHSAGFRRFITKAPMPVVVAALDGGWHMSSIGKVLTKLNGGRYRVKILKIYPPPATKEEQLHILEEGKQLITKQLEIWRAENQQ